MWAYRYSSVPWLCYVSKYSIVNFHQWFVGRYSKVEEWSDAIKPSMFEWLIAEPKGEAWYFDTILIIYNPFNKMHTCKSWRFPTQYADIDKYTDSHAVVELIKVSDVATVCHNASQMMWTWMCGLVLAWSFLLTDVCQSMHIYPHIIIGVWWRIVLALAAQRRAKHVTAPRDPQTQRIIRKRLSCWTSR